MRHKVSVVCIRSQLLEVVERSDPLVDATQSIAKQFRKSGVAAVDPSSWSNSVGLILKLSWVELVEFLENSLFQQLRMKGSDSIDCVRANNTQIGHPDFLGVAFLNEGQPLNLGTITWVLLLQFGQVNVVDQIDELHVSWKKIGNEVNGPLLESLRQHSVVRVREGMINDLPCGFERQLLLINQNTEQLDSSNCWMSIVQLDLVLGGELCEGIIVTTFVFSNDVVQGC